MRAMVVRVESLSDWTNTVGRRWGGEGDYDYIIVVRPF